jgi:group II intron reverse transcriptase/maturase
MAVVLVLEPIFEADLEPEQHAYRPKRSALDAVREVEQHIRTGRTEVVDADLSGFFDSIPHPELLKSVSRRVSDGRVLRLIKMWLELPVEEVDGRGERHRTTRNKDQAIGTPQGAPISPLLSNIYMRRFVRGWKTGGHERRLDACIVNYADDFVICCRGTAEQAMHAMRTMMSKLKLTVNEAKTRLCRLPQETFDFLSYTQGRIYDSRTGESYLGPRPSRKKVERLCCAISAMTTRRKVLWDVDEQIGRINRKLRGWSNYFCIGTVSKTYRAVNGHVAFRVRQWLRAKFKARGPVKTRFPDHYLYQELGLYQLQRKSRVPVSWAKV